MDALTHFSSQFLKWVTEVAVRVDAQSTTPLEPELEEKLRQAGIAIAPPDASRPVTLRVSSTRVSSTADADQSTLNTSLTLTVWLVPVCGSYQASETRIWWGRRSQVVSNADIDTSLRQDVHSLVDEFVARIGRRVMGEIGVAIP